MSFLNNFKLNSNKITEEKTNLETVVSLFFYFLLALYRYFSGRGEKIDGMDVPQLQDNYDLNLD